MGKLRIKSFDGNDEWRVGQGQRDMRDAFATSRCFASTAAAGALSARDSVCTPPPRKYVLVGSWHEEREQLDFFHVSSWLAI